jgi:hypothetical protein
MYGATPSRGSTPEAPAEAVPPAASSAGRRTAAACGALLALAALTARASTPRAGGAAAGADAAAASLRKYVDDDGLVGDDYVHKNWPGLVCNRDDDDSYNWGDKDSVMGCIRGDSYNCEHWGVGAEIAVCNATCNATDERIVEDAMSEYGDEWREHAPLKGHSWLVVCAWEAIADMRSWCGDAFTPYLPIAQSKNLAPSRENGKQAAPLQFNGSWPGNSAGAWDACNVHAFCYTCANDDGSLNAYCEAVLQKYSQHVAWNLGTPSQIRSWVYWNKESYWCTDDVLSSIENGTFLENIQDGGALHSGGWWHYT